MPKDKGTPFVVARGSEQTPLPNLLSDLINGLYPRNVAQPSNQLIQHLQNDTTGFAISTTIT